VLIKLLAVLNWVPLQVAAEKRGMASSREAAQSARHQALNMCILASGSIWAECLPPEGSAVNQTQMARWCLFLKSAWGFDAFKA
jgi:hypothetical protein